jgi:hypothetical protein
MPRFVRWRFVPCPYSHAALRPGRGRVSVAAACQPPRALKQGVQIAAQVVEDTSGVRPDHRPSPAGDRPPTRGFVVGRLRAADAGVGRPGQRRPPLYSVWLRSLEALNQLSVMQAARTPASWPTTTRLNVHLPLRYAAAQARAMATSRSKACSTHAYGLPREPIHPLLDGTDLPRCRRARRSRARWARRTALYERPEPALPVTRTSGCRWPAHSKVLAACGPPLRGALRAQETC